MDLAVTVGIGVCVAISVHVLAKYTSDNLKTWRAASQIPVRSATANPEQRDLGLQTPDSNIRQIQLRHIALASVLYLLQLGLTIRWLAWIAGVLANK